jgi:Ca-activated chloride channel family protein
VAPSFSQYYLRGEIRDDKGNAVGGAKITLASKGEYPFYAGSSGSFGIPISHKTDTIAFYAEGFETLSSPVIATEFKVFNLKALSKRVNSTKVRLTSFTKNFSPSETHSLSAMGESYSSTIENQFVPANKFPETGFALNVNRASYSNVRRFLNSKGKPPPDAVRIEELLNYFNFRSKNISDQKETISINSQLTSCPWQEGNRLLFINVQAKKLRFDKTPPANLVFLIDVSGSMDKDNRLPLLKSGFKLLVENLRPIDTVSIITYGSDVAIMLQPTSGNQKERIISAIEGLQPAGSTPGESAIRLAYKFAKKNYIQNGTNRIILATDGDFNVGQTTEKELEELVIKEKQSGIYLTCLGVGMGDYKDSKLETLAKHGNGNFAYLDNETEAEKVLVEEFAQTVYSVANNVFANVKFDASKVKSYRLIGFDNKKEASSDTSVHVEGGELGSGHSLLAVFEIEPAPNVLTKGDGDILGNLSLSYREQGKKDDIQKPLVLRNNYIDFDHADTSLQFASSVIMFGGLLKQSPFAKNMSWDLLRKIAASSSNPNNLLQKEFLQLIDASEKMFVPRKKKKTDIFSLK